MELEYQTILRWINQTVIKEKISSSSKIISLLSGGSSVKITSQSIKSADKKLNTDKKFLELIGTHFGQELKDRISQLYPILSLMLLNRSQDKEQNGGGANLEYFILPIVVIIIGYSYIEKIGEDIFKDLVIECVCYCIYLLVTDDSEEVKKENNARKKRHDTLIKKMEIFQNEIINSGTSENKGVEKDRKVTVEEDEVVEEDVEVEELKLPVLNVQKLFKYNSDKDYLYINTDNELILNSVIILSDVKPNMLFYNLRQDTIYKLDIQANTITLSNYEDTEFKEFANIKIQVKEEEITQFKISSNKIFILFKSTLKGYNKDNKEFTEFCSFESVNDFCVLSEKMYFINDKSLVLFNYKSKAQEIIKETKQIKQIINIDEKLFSLINNKIVLSVGKLRNYKPITNVESFQLIKYNNQVYILTSMQDNTRKLYKIQKDSIHREQKLEEQLLDLFKSFISSGLDGGANPANPTPTDKFSMLSMLSMVTKGIRWTVTNIKSYIKESIDLTREWIKSPDKSFETFVILLTKVATGSKSNLSPEILNSYSFNGGTGHIEFLGKLPGRIETLLTPKIKFYVKYNSKLGQNETKYFFNRLPMDTISYIESRPIATALVIGWIESTNSKHLISPEQIIAKSQSKYVFELNPDGQVIVYNRETKAPVQSIQTSIDLWLGSNSTQAKISATEVCKEMFGVSTGLDNPTCSQYFYSVLGRSGLTMVKILGKQVETSSDIKSLLLGTNPGIKYEILKKLGWKINSSNKLIDFDNWVKTQPIEFGDYFKTKPGLEVKSILEGYIQDIQTHLENDLKKDINQTNVNPSKKNHAKRLTSSQVAALRSIQIDQTSKLIKDKETYNIKGLILPKYFNMSGGSDFKLDTTPVTDLDKKFNFIKFQLAGGNKIISSNTENKINSLIQSVSLLEQLNSPLYPAKLIKLNKTFSKLEDYLK
jgi:hypothetical protein